MTWLVGGWPNGWPNHFTQDNPMDSVQVGKAVFVKEKLHNPGNRTQDLLLTEVFLLMSSILREVVQKICPHFQNRFLKSEI